jgi:hypothetical protein
MVEWLASGIPDQVVDPLLDLRDRRTLTLLRGPAEHTGGP